MPFQYHIRNLFRQNLRRFKRSKPDRIDLMELCAVTQHIGLQAVRHGTFFDLGFIDLRCSEPNRRRCPIGSHKAFCEIEILQAHACFISNDGLRRRLQLAAKDYNMEAVSGKFQRMGYRIRHKGCRFLCNIRNHAGGCRTCVHIHKIMWLNQGSSISSAVLFL